MLKGMMNKLASIFYTIPSGSGLSKKKKNGRIRSDMDRIRQHTDYRPILEWDLKSNNIFSDIGIKRPTSDVADIAFQYRCPPMLRTEEHGGSVF